MPDGKKPGKVTVLTVYRYLPGTNCKKCGFASCMVFASKLLTKEVKIEDCPPLLEPKYKDKLEGLRELLKPILETKETGVRVDPDKCTGCGNCVVVCPANVAVDPQIGRGLATTSDEVVLRVEDGVIQIIKLEKCRRFPPHGLDCRVCEQYCYTGAIEVF